MPTETGIHIISGFPGTSFNKELKYLIKDIQVGGLIFFKHNVKDPLQVTELCTSIQRFALATLQRPLFLAIDQEGGKVQRLKPPFTQIPSASELATKGYDAVYHFSAIIAREMRQVGLNVNLAPVVDISSKNPSPFIETRSYGDNPESVSRFSGVAFTTFLKQGIIPTVKHFPGLGEAQKDPHFLLPVIDRSYEQMQNWELVPFTRAFSAGSPCCMTSHALYHQLDDSFPATLSEKILVTLLRHEIGFKGIVISDDLEMGALSKFADFKEVVHLAWRAQNDFLLICHDLENVQLLYEVLEKSSHGQSFKNYHAQSSARIQKLHSYLQKQSLLPNSNSVKEYFKI